MEILRNIGFNIDGICRVRFAFLHQVKEISYPDENYQVNVTLKSGNDFSEIYFTKTTEDCQIEQRNDESGFYYKTAIKLINPRLEPGKAANFAAMEQKDMIFIITDSNGNNMLVGSINMPARLSYKMSFPGKGRNQRLVSINATSDLEPFYVAEEITTLGGGFSQGFSSGFSIQEAS